VRSFIPIAAHPESTVEIHCRSQWIDGLKRLESVWNQHCFIASKFVMELTLECQPRTPGSKPNALRREGKLPASLYGHKGAESVSLVVNMKDAETLIRKTNGKPVPITLAVSDQSWNGTVVLQEVQSHPWKGSLQHISFFSTAATEA
jgi:ribosomal protein L25 (general stress protein Ctc)